MYANLFESKIEMTKAEAKNAGKIGTDEYNTLMNLMKSFPTFTIEMVYHGREMDLDHFDLYRLDRPEQLEDTGLFDVLGADGVCVIEWGEQFADEIGDDRLDVYLSRLDDEAAVGEEPRREIRLVPRCARAEQIVAAL